MLSRGASAPTVLLPPQGKESKTLSIGGISEAQDNQMRASRCDLAQERMVSGRLVEAGQGPVRTRRQSSRRLVTFPGPRLNRSGSISPLSETPRIALSSCTPLQPGVGHMALSDLKLPIKC